MSFALTHQSDKSKEARSETPVPHHKSSYYYNTLTKDSDDYVINVQQQNSNQSMQRQLVKSKVQFNFLNIGTRPKLKISQPNDSYEQEASKVAEEVVRMSIPNSVASRRTAKEQGIGRKCSTCEMVKKDNGDENLDIIRKPSSTFKLETTNEIMNKTKNIRSSSGLPLDSEIRRFMEPRIGYNFSDVRIHTDSNATESVQTVGAQAYTVGSDIVFGPGQFSPNTSSGRRLLAHELAHVVQQSEGLMQGIQRQPNDAAQTQVVVQDPDAEEAAARAADPSLATIDRLQTSKQNEDAVNAIVLRAFGGEDGLNATFESLSDEVKSQVDKDSEKEIGDKVKKLEMKTVNRVQFFVRMRLYFSSWSDLLNHFRAIKTFKFDAKLYKNKNHVSVPLHPDTWERLERALTVLDSKGRQLPKIHGGFSLRGRYKGKFHSEGMMTHALGYAFDISAKENPHIIFGKPEEEETPSPNQIATTVGPKRAHMNMELSRIGKPGLSNETFIESMGERTASNDRLSATDDPDPTTKKYFELFEEQFRQMEAASIEFKNTISKDNRDKLFGLRSRYFEILNILKSERKKGSKRNRDLIKSLEGEQRQLLNLFPTLITEWIAAINAEIEDVLKKNGMDKLRPPSDISLELKTAQSEVKEAMKNQGQAQSSKARAIAARDLASNARERAEAWKRHAPAGAEFKKALDWTNTERRNLAMKLDAVVDAIEKEMETRKELARVTSSRDALASELKKSNAPGLGGKWNWIARLRQYRKSLEIPDLSTPSSMKAYERLTIGDLTELGPNAPPRNPPLLRLLDIGFFNPKEGFDLDFFKEMAHSGFWPGATWSNPDPMHFELVKGRRSILSPGTIPKPKKS